MPPDARLIKQEMTAEPAGSVSLRPRTDPWWRLRRQILERWHLGSVPAANGGWLLKTDLFDEASGPYHHATRLPPGVSFLGIDREFAIARWARNRLAPAGGGPQVVVADVRSLPFRNGSIAQVLSLSTLDHFDDVSAIERSLAELHRVLRAGGRLVMTLDNPANPEVWLRQRLPAPLVRWLRADRFPLGVTLGRRRGRQLIALQGFMIHDETALVHAPRYWAIRALAWAERRLPPRAQGWLERLVLWLEWLAVMPVGWLSGHYLGWVGERTDRPAHRD